MSQKRTSKDKFDLILSLASVLYYLSFGVIALIFFIFISSFWLVLVCAALGFVAFIYKLPDFLMRYRIPTKNVIVYNGFSLKVLYASNERPTSIPLEDIEHFRLIEEKEYSESYDKLQTYYTFEAKEKSGEFVPLLVFNTTSILAQSSFKPDAELVEEATYISERIAKAVGRPLKKRY